MQGSHQNSDTNTIVDVSVYKCRGLDHKGFFIRKYGKPLNVHNKYGD